MRSGVEQGDKNGTGNGTKTQRRDSNSWSTRSNDGEGAIGKKSGEGSETKKTLKMGYLLEGMCAIRHGRALKARRKTAQTSR